MIRFIFVLLLLSTVGLYSYSQLPTQTIRGTVIDNASNEPLPFANTVILNTSLGTSTDVQGNFIIRDVPVGRYQIQVSMIGYEPYLIKEVQVSSGKELFLNISMKENTGLLSEVEVKPTVNKEQPLNSLASVSAKMLSVEEARRYAGGFDDPARLVSSFAGVSSNVSNNAIVIRGNSPQSLQWKMEGVEIPNPNHFADLTTFGGGGLTALSSQLLANSDFFSGAMPAEYNNALSGVFDIFMRNGNITPEHTFQLGLLGIDASAEGPFKKNGSSTYLFNYRYSTLSLLESILPENAGGTTYQDLSFKLNFITKKAGTISLWGIGLTDGSGAEPKTNQSLWKYDSDMEKQDVKQYMGAVGLNHKISLNKMQYLKTTLAATMNGIDFSTDRIATNLEQAPKNKIGNRNYSFVLATFLNTKFNTRHTNKTGFTATGMKYNLLIKNAPIIGDPLNTIVEENGISTLLSAYTNSTINLSNRFTFNGGINAQLFTLNNNYTVEPRLGIKYHLVPSMTLSFAYGLHSRLERLNYYFVKNRLNGDVVNKNLDFTKSHHFVLGYDIGISDYLHFKIEAYYQHLFNVPVIADSSFSMINQQNDWFFNERLQNTGLGENYGLDLSLEKYLSHGYYFMLTGSLFTSRYKGGDDIWRDTRYNRNFAFNYLFGKEWQTGKYKQNSLGINARICFQGGDHYSPVNATASLVANDAVFDETRAFSKQFSPSFTSHFTASYKINKKGSAHEIALKIINATMYQEFTGFQFNYQTQKVDERREALFIPNLSYKIEF
ncbi:MAG: TonB-dependent receptor [Mariniphaga sp.]